MKEEIKKELFKKILKQQRDAYEFAKYMISNFTEKDMSYSISTNIVFKGDKFQPVTELIELPYVRVINGKAIDDETTEKTTEIDNVS